MMNEESIFYLALDKPPIEREALLDQACQRDPVMRGRVERLLAEHDCHDGFVLDLPPAGLDATLHHPISERPGTVIGPYKLLQQIGEGGMGIVFMAEQTTPVRRKVALKIIKPGMDSRQVIARFEAERQALALMDHPNIARVFDAGTTSSGRPYFVMELVHGVPITDYCNEQKLTPSERLKLFVEVCRAVQHAHQKGIIHRDLKPSNVMVTMRDDVAVPKIIDFGVSKAMSQQLTEKTLFTAFGQMVGTPMYMSPEQAQLSELDVDTRSDVYSLGVLLYELVTSTTPFDEATFKRAGFDEMRRMIREEEPLRPSLRINTLKADVLSTVSDERKVDPEKLSQSLRGEVDWIVMKCLEKDRNRRYESANGLAADITRYLNDEAVQACPPSVKYRFGKFVRRHKAALTTAALLAGVLLLSMIGLAISTVLIWKANNESRLLTYFQRVALAEREWSANNLTRAEELLALCPTDLRAWEWHYVKRLRGKPLPLMRHNNMIWGCAVSPNGKQIVSVDHVGNVYCWDADTGREIRTPTQCHDSAGQYVAFCPDGCRFASAGWNDVKIWDAASGEQLHTWTMPSGTIQGLAYGADGRVLVCVSNPANEFEETHIWDAATGQQLFGLPGLKLLAYGMALSPDEKLLAVGGHDKTVRIVDSRSGKLIRTFRGDRKVWCVAFSPDGSLIAAGSGTEAERGSGSVKIWEVASGRERSPVSRHGARSLAFSPNGARLATGGIDQAVKIWDVASAQEILTLRGHADWVFGVDFTPDGHRLVSASADRTMRVWDATPWSEAEKFGDDTVTLRGHTDAVNAVAFHPKKPELATASTDGTVKIWNTQTWRELRTVRSGGTVVWDVAFAPGGDRLAIIADQSRAVVLVDAASDDELQRLKLEAGADPARIAFGPSGKLLAVTDHEGEVTIFDITSGARVHRLPTAGKVQYDVSFSPNDKLVAAAGADGLVTIWDTTLGREIEASPLRHQGVVEAVAFSPDGKLLASGGWDRTVRLWDTVAWNRSETVIDAMGAMHCIAFSPDSQFVAWGASDSTVKLWDRTSGQIHILRGHFGWVHSVAFSPDGRFLASGSDDGTAKIWTLPLLGTKP
jgi:WD40 repeat protein/serine/threonine protein kinase